MQSCPGPGRADGAVSPLCPRSTADRLLPGTAERLLSADRLLSEAELGAPEGPVADKKAPGSERAAERAAAAQHNSERARLAPQPSFVNMQVRLLREAECILLIAQ